MINIRYTAITTTIIIVSVFLLVKCTSNSGHVDDTPGKIGFDEFAGSVSCASCHKDIYDKHIHTEHHNTSAIANEGNIMGSFEKGKSEFVFDGITAVAMEKRDSGYYQAEYINDKEVRKGRFDIVIGSGRKGQSYLSWNGDHLAQLPITYFTAAAQWSNSPGYPPNKVVYNRPITSRCLECHSTYFDQLPDPASSVESFDHNRIIFGVDCEKCHGPAARHVEFQSQHPEVKEARFVANPGRFSRQQYLDLCALCHGGRLSKTKPSFAFQSGDTLSNYFSLNTNPVEAISIDVHGNQYGLLSASKCFTNSALTCSSCHNVHENENGKTVLFSQRCMNCHNEEKGHTCKINIPDKAIITQNCIDCHMPKQASHAIAVYLQGSGTPTAALLRTHLIAIYPEQTDKVLALIRESKKKK